MKMTKREYDETPYLVVSTSRVSEEPLVLVRAVVERAEHTSASSNLNACGVVHDVIGKSLIVDTSGDQGTSASLVTFQNVECIIAIEASRKG
jgi:hypothetical protein